MATTEAAAAAGEATQKGMPQLNFATWPNQIFWLLVALAIIYVVLTRVALPRIAAILAERKGTIGNDIAAAEELKSRAKAAEAAYNLALEQARIEAGKIIATTKAEIQTGLNAAIGTADAAISVKSAEGAARIADIRAGAMAAVAEVARDTAGALVLALGGHADAGTIEAAVTARLKG